MIGAVLTFGLAGLLLGVVTSRLLNRKTYAYPEPGKRFFPDSPGIRTLFIFRNSCLFRFTLRLRVSGQQSASQQFQVGKSIDHRIFSKPFNNKDGSANNKDGSANGTPAELTSIIHIGDKQLYILGINNRKGRKQADPLPGFACGFVGTCLPSLFPYFLFSLTS